VYVTIVSIDTNDTKTLSSIFYVIRL